MTGNVFPEAEVTAGNDLVELITPNSDAIAANQEIFADALYDVGRNSNVVESIILALADNATFLLEEIDNETLIEKVSHLALAWDVDVLFGSHDSEEEYTYHVDVPSLLAAAYSELQFSGLTLWCTYLEDGQLGGFIVRQSDEDLVEKIARICNVEVMRVDESIFKLNLDR